MKYKPNNRGKQISNGRSKARITCCNPNAIPFTMEKGNDANEIEKHATAKPL